MIKNASLITNAEGNYLLQVRNIANPIENERLKFMIGEYPFTWPGACSLFGGELEEEENAEEGFVREVLKEELPGLIINIKPEHRQYDWSKQVDEVVGRVNEALYGNVRGLLGFDLNGAVPWEVLGVKYRSRFSKDKGLSYDIKNSESCKICREAYEKNPVSYRDWLSLTTEDNFFVCNLNQKDLEGIAVKEGAGKNMGSSYIGKRDKYGSFR